MSAAAKVSRGICTGLSSPVTSAATGIAAAKVGAVAALRVGEKEGQGGAHAVAWLARRPAAAAAPTASGLATPGGATRVS